MGRQPHSKREVTKLPLTAQLVSKRSNIWPHMQSCSIQSCSTVCHRELETDETETGTKFGPVSLYKIEAEPTDLPPSGLYSYPNRDF